MIEYKRSNARDVATLTLVELPSAMLCQHERHENTKEVYTVAALRRQVSSSRGQHACSVSPLLGHDRGGSPKCRHMPLVASMIITRSTEPFVIPSVSIMRVSIQPNSKELISVESSRVA